MLLIFLNKIHTIYRMTSHLRSGKLLFKSRRLQTKWLTNLGNKTHSQGDASRAAVADGNRISDDVLIIHLMTRRYRMNIRNLILRVSWRTICNRGYPTTVGLLKLRLLPQSTQPYDMTCLATWRCLQFPSHCLFALLWNYEILSSEWSKYEIRHILVIDFDIISDNNYRILAVLWCIKPCLKHCRWSNFHEIFHHNDQNIIVNLYLIAEVYLPMIYHL